jgi:hypothetical protein
MHTDLFTQYLVQVAIKTSLIGAVMAIVSGVFLFAGQLSFAVLNGGMGIRLDETIGQALFAMGQFAALVGSILIVNICRPALVLWNRLRSFDEYSAAVPNEIRTRVGDGRG